MPIVATQSQESGTNGPRVLTRRLVIILIVGVVIVGALGATTTIETECDYCDGDGKIECPFCKGIGAIGIPFSVECACRGEDPDCPICGGEGEYNTFTTTPCDICLGKGYEICSKCGGDGRIKLIERFLKR